MRIGIPCQNHNERRVALNPETVAKLIANGHQVVVETGAGDGAGWADGAYIDAGASVASSEDVWRADLVATVGTVDTTRVGSNAVIGLLRPFDRQDEMTRLAGSGALIFAFEAVPRTTRAQTMDALSSQATVAGYQAVIEASGLSDRLFPMLTTAAGTLPPAKVLVLGAGVAGLQAIATARRLGAVVSAFDVRAAAAEQVKSLGASFVSLDITTQDSAASGGYAQEVAQDEQTQILAGLAPKVAESDVVITTAAIPGKPAPLLITGAMVASMRSGAVIVDLAASTGGNCESTVPGEVVEVGGVTIVGSTDLESRKAADASRMYARNMAAFIDLVTGEDGGFHPDWEDDIVAGACIARDGIVVHPRLAQP